MIKDYLRYRRSLLLFYVSVMIFFPLVHLLSRSPFAPMGYSMLIITFLLCLWMIADAIRFRMRVKKLREIKAQLTSFPHDYPEPGNAAEREYREIVGRLYGIIETDRYESQKRRTEETDYYTMWVHQIKTPISAMRLALQSGAHDPVIEQELFKIEQYAEMALQFVKLDHPETDLVIREYSLQSIVRDCVRKYASLFIYRKLPVEIGDIDRTVVTDSKWLSFLIEQLLSNAIKYTRQGAVSICLDEGRLVIRDTGIGIRDEDKERIFEKGFTGYNGRVDKRASGIGLYMAKKAADLLAIKIRIDSKVGDGTAATLEFPEKTNDLSE